jgi:hypothetical protein
MSMAQELLFELGDVRITPHLAQFGGTSYQISSIGSVRVIGRRKRNPVAVVLFLVGLGLLVAAAVAGSGREPLDINVSATATGLGLMAAAVLLQLAWPRRVFTVMLKTSSGDVAAFSSRKKQLVFNVKQAVEQAFIARAPQRG